MDRQTSVFRRLAIALPALLVVWVAAQVATPGKVEANMEFTQTGARLSGPFETYWKANGGLDRFGMPLTGVFSVDAGHAAQWFERAVLLYYPNNPDGYKVQVQDLGWIVSAPRCVEAPFGRASAPGSGQYFAITGHSLSGKFLDYWKNHGGLAAYGYPLSEVFTERNKANGKEYTVQYFERARFELHPEAAGSTYEVQLGLIGAERLASLGGAGKFAGLAVPSFYPSSGQPGQASPGVYPKEGHAPDYSWVAGRVSDINPLPRGRARPSLPPQIHAGPGPIYAPPPTPPTPVTYPNGVTVGGSTHSDVSPPLRSITPLPATPECSASAADNFLPAGSGWSISGLKDGDYVLVFGHVAAPGEAGPAGNLGRPYIVNRMMAGR